MRCAEHDSALVVREELRLERRADAGPGPRILLHRRRQRLVCDQLRLDDEPRRLVVERLDLVQDRGDRPVHEGNKARGADPHTLARRRDPFGLPAQQAGPEVERSLVLSQLPVADVERLVVDQQADDLAVGDVEHRLPGLGIAVAALGVGQRPGLVEAVEVGPGQSVRLALLEVPAEPDVPVGEGEERLAVGQYGEIEMGFAHAPTARS